MAEPATPEPRYSLRARILITVGFAVAGGLFYLAYVTSTASEGPDGVAVTGAGLPFFVERVSPTPDTEQLGQTELTLDLIPGWQGDFDVRTAGRVVDLPSDELRVVPELNEVHFRPGPGRAVESWEGDTCVLARAWETSRGPGAARTFTWCFDALAN